MPETSHHIDSVIRKSTERLGKKHFRYTLVFGQGPVQEARSVPRTGREGLNFHSRLIGLAAAEMLNDGVTDTVIISGGQTGVRAGRPEAKTEAELIADVVRRRIVRRSPDNAYTLVGRTGRVPLFNADHTPRKKVVIQKDIQNILNRCIQIENRAKDTLENVGNIFSEHLSRMKPREPVAFLGIGFHAHDTWSGAGIGRLEKLANVLQIPIQTFSAEGIVEKIHQKRRIYDKIGRLRKKVSRLKNARGELSRLTHLSLHHPVSQYKSMQERLLVEGLDNGAWVPLVKFLHQEKNIRKMIAKDSYIMDLLAKTKIDARFVARAPIEDVIAKVTSLPIAGVDPGYGNVKAGVFAMLETLSRETGIDYFGKYAKETFTLDYLKS